MSAESLPNRRPHQVVEFWHEGTFFRGGFGDVGEETAETPIRGAPAALPGGGYADVREVWLTPDVRSGSLMEAIAQDLAVVASLALRHGCPIGTIEAALAKLADGAPAGPLGVLLRRIREGLA